MNDKNDVAPLVELGFTPMEAQVYTLLLKNSPQTGYSIAKNLGAPAAYTYRAISSLERKGAVLIDDGDTKMCRAVPYLDLLGQMEHQFKNRKESAAEYLSQFHGSQDDNRIYQLTTTQQVFERSRRMIENADLFIYLDIYPQPFKELEKTIRETIDRGVLIALLVYEPVDLPEAFVIRCSPERILKNVPRQWLRIGVDATQYLDAFLDGTGKEVHQAIWSASPILSYLHQYSLGSDIINSLIMNALHAGASSEEIMKAYNAWKIDFRSKISEASVKKMAKFTKEVTK